VTIPELLAWSARQWPDKECVVEFDPQANQRKSLTYRQFDQRVNQVVNALLSSGIKKGDKVLHFMRNRMEWLESYFGIIRIGALVVPLNFRFTNAEITYTAGIVEPSLVFVEDDLADLLNPAHPSMSHVAKYVSIGGEHVEGMENYEQYIASHSVTHPNANVSEADDLGIYFTSGTTGQPKAILYTHKNLYTVAVINGLSIPMPPQPNSVIYCPLYHTATFFFWLPCLFKGGKAILLNRFSPHYLLKTIEQERGTEVNIPMPHCVEIIAAHQTGQIRISDYDLSSWYLINTGAQPYPMKVLHDLAELLPTVGTQHGFGISEGGGATLTRLPPDELFKKPGSVGRPVAMVEAMVVNNEGQPVPPGQLGELVIKTERMMKEYYKNPEATAAAIKNGWLYTGDIARMDEDGYLYIVDRKKDVIISGGENVYPVEIENILATHPKILEIAVIGTPDEKWGECVTAVVKLRPGQEMNQEELLEWCRDKFPSYKRPRRVEFGDLPKSPTNKILKPALRLRYSGKESAF
jgi:acyl-CoA synthetase (AMP-forming)/AMP-acid ligase II